jgi:histidinol phosphatase-like enzyme
MSGRRILFLDRDGTLNEEAPDEQVDSLAKIRLMPDVVPALLELKRAGFAFVMVTNQDGLGTASFPRESNSKRWGYARTSSATAAPAASRSSACSTASSRHTRSTSKTAS